MKKRILLAISVLLVLGLAIAAFAYNQSSGSLFAKAACSCCTGDSCPMKKDSAAAGQTASCCDSDDCCCKKGGDSCPMKMHGEHTAMHDDSGAAKAGCDCSCCKDKANA